MSKDERVRGSMGVFDEMFEDEKSQEGDTRLVLSQEEQDDAYRKVLAIFPLAQMDMDNEGQLVFYTGVLGVKKCTCGNPQLGFNCVCDWVKKHPGKKNYACEFDGIYTASKPRCNKCEEYK